MNSKLNSIMKNSELVALYSDEKKPKVKFCHIR